MRTPTHLEVHRANRDEVWQRCREQMKGKSTRYRLMMLRLWLRRNDVRTSKQTREVQVMHYLLNLVNGGFIFIDDPTQEVSQMARHARVIK